MKKFKQKKKDIDYECGSAELVQRPKAGKMKSVDSMSLTL